MSTLLPLRYLIGLDADPGEAGAVTVIGYDAEALPINGVGYMNARKNTPGRDPGVMYLPEDDIEREYGEPAFVFTSLSFWDNFDPQVAKWKRLGASAVEIDNLDTYDVPAALKMFDACQKAGLGVWVKNAAIIEGDRKRLLEHAAAVGCIVERDCGTPATYDALRKAAGKPDLPIRFVSYGGGKQWAQQIAGTIQAADYPNMGVTHSDDGEYRSSTDVLLPTNPEKPMSDPAWLAQARASIGKYGDADAPRLAREVAEKYPDMEDYAAQATSKTPWCGIFFAAMMTRAGIRPPYDSDNVDTDDFMWADAPIEAKWGTIVSRAEARSGDVVVLRTPHHITFFDGNNGDSFWGLGGNQSNAVTRASFSWDGVRAVVRPPTTNPLPVSSWRFSVCLPRVLKHEGGNDDDPRDPGGRTSRGITAERWAEWRKTHPGLPADVWEAPQSEVEAIYREKYWDVLWCDQLPVGVDYAVFDFGVNSGPARSASFLQEIVGSEVDGEVGPNTVAATKAASAAGVISELCDDRMTFLQGLSTWGTYGRGWTNRVNDVRRDALADAGAVPDEPVDEPDEPVDEPSTNAAVEAALKDVIAALRPILEKHMAPQPAAPQFDWGALLAPLVKELLPKLLPVLLPYIIQLLPQLLPLLLKGMSTPQEKSSGGMNNPAVVGAGAGSIGAIIGGLLTAFLTGKVPQ